MSNEGGFYKNFDGFKKKTDRISLSRYLVIKKIIKVIFWEKLNFQIMMIKKSILLPLYLCFVTFLSLGEAKLVSAQQPSCQDTVNSVLKNIRNRGATVRYEISKNEYQQEDLNTTLGNTNRISGISIVLETNSDLVRSSSVASNILHSRVLMKNYANQMFSRCGGTGIVSFGEDNTDGFISFAMRDDGVLSFEECHDSRANITNPISSISYSQALGYYCAYVIPDF